MSAQDDQLTAERRIIVCAGNARIVEQWRREQGLSQRQVIYASSPRVILGLRDLEVVRLPGWEDHPHAEEIAAILDTSR